MASFHLATELACCSTNRTTEHVQPYPIKLRFSHAPITTDSFLTVLAKPLRTLHHMLAHHMISALA